MTSQIPVFVINLDRRPDRLEFMQAQLDGLGVHWSRISALDAQTAPDARIREEVKLSDHRIGMGRGSQCCAITNFDIFRKMEAQQIAAALIVQDDIEVSPDILPYLATTDWIPKDVGLVQFEKYGAKKSTRLAGPVLGAPVSAGRELRRLYSRTAGAGCYLITREAASLILARKPVLDTPIDHFLFSPNVSPLFNALGVAIVTPALAEQKMEDLASDIAAERTRRPKSLPARLRRLWLDVNRVPGQIAAMLRGARWVPFHYRRSMTE